MEQRLVLEADSAGLSCRQQDLVVVTEGERKARLIPGGLDSSSRQMR